jgi:YegS/Rv2252/BmrU family lipid kinase
MKRIKFVYNPFSGENIIIKELDKVIEVYQKNGYTVEPFRFTLDSNYNELFKVDTEKDYEHILVAGGDGTVNKVVNLMIKSGQNAPLAVLPTGTANDFSNLIGMPKNIEKACEQIIKSEIKYIDLGKINEDYFVNVASAGLFADVSQKTDTNLKNTIGKLAYYVSGIMELPKFKKLKVEVHSKEYNFSGNMYLIFVFNGRTAGNLDLAYKSKIDDGLFDVIIIKASNFPFTNTIASFIKLLMSEHLDKNKNIIHFKTKNLNIECLENISTDIDGEKGPNFPLKISCIEGGLKVLGFIEKK